MCKIVMHGAAQGADSCKVLKQGKLTAPLPPPPPPFCSNLLPQPRPTLITLPKHPIMPAPSTVPHQNPDKDAIVMASPVTG
jgi:hypothetical protein